MAKKSRHGGVGSLNSSQFPRKTYFGGLYAAFACDSLDGGTGRAVDNSDAQRYASNVDSNRLLIICFVPVYFSISYLL